MRPGFVGDLLLYKFCSISANNGRWKCPILESVNLKFSNVRTFNDINEAYPSPDSFTRNLSDKFIEGIESGEISLPGHWSEREKSEEMQKLRTDPEYLTCRNYLHYQEIWDNLQSAFSEIGILCMTLEWNNLLMWAHYAKFESLPAAGLCLGFDEKSEIFTGSEIPEYEMKGGYEVCYQPKRVKLQENSMSLNLINSFTTKSIDWQYEREVRFFRKLDVPELAKLEKFDPSDLREIMLGPKLSMEGGDRFANYCRSRFPNATLFLTVPDLDNFQLVRLPAPSAEKLKYLIKPGIRLP